MTVPSFSICEDVPRSKRKKILVASIVVVVIVVALVLFLPATGRPTPSMAMSIRCDSLTDWYEFVNSYISENNQVPLSLIEVCQAAHRKGQRPFPPGGGLVNDGFPKEYTIKELNDPKGFHELYTVDLLKDPNRFEKEVPYGLFVRNKGWFIRELRPGKIYKKMLMIDQGGRIYEIQELPREKYSRP